MMRITTLCSAFILSILSLSLFAQESVEPSSLPTDSLQSVPEVSWAGTTRSIVRKTVAISMSSRRAALAFTTATTRANGQKGHGGSTPTTMFGLPARSYTGRSFPSAPISRHPAPSDKRPNLTPKPRSPSCAPNCHTS